MSRAHIHVISGPSSAGKSSYIQANRERYDDVLFPGKLGPDKIEASKRYALHYNLLKPIRHVDLLKRERSLSSKIRAARWQREIRRGDPYDSERTLKVLFDLDADITVTVLVVPRRELERRMGDRVDREPLADAKLGYSEARWVSLLRSVDLEAIYDAWLRFLDSKSVPVELVVSKDGGFSPLRDRGLAEALVEAP